MNGSCRNAVQKNTRDRVSDGRPEPSTNTSGYCQARQRLAMSYLQNRFEQTIAVCQSLTDRLDQWHGHTVCVVDGTSAQMPDTPPNQRVFPQNSQQKPGCGFPIAKLCGIFDLASGTMMRYDVTHNNEHESVQLGRMDDVFAPDSVMLSDRGFSSFACVAQMYLKRVWCVVRKHQCLSKSLRVIERLGRNDHLCEWKKPVSQTAHIDKKTWESLPDLLTVRRIRVHVDNPGKRTKNIEIITTLIDHMQYPADAFAELYLRRWRVELFFDDIKTSMGMDMLRCKTPEMVTREILVYMTAYNLIRLMMCTAGLQNGVCIDRISFTGTRDIIEIWQPRFACVTSNKQIELWEAMLRYIAHDTVPHRPGRREPRARKRRPKPYQLLTEDRHTFQEIPHRNRYKKP